jgi:glucose/sorbosone dehydrogenase
VTSNDRENIEHCSRPSTRTSARIFCWGSLLETDGVTVRRGRLTLLAVLVALGLALIAVRLTAEPHQDRSTPMDIEWVDGHGYASLAEGRLLRLTQDGDRLSTEVLAEGLAFPRGIAVAADTLYVAELGSLPCKNPIPRCKGENVGPTTADGERLLLSSSSGRILAYPVVADGLGEPAVLVDGLHYTNTDHGLNDLDLGPDGMLYLSIGNLDQLAWDDGGNPPPATETELLGSILRIDPASGDVEVFATGLRNVFGIAFDADGQLWGVDNDGRGRGTWRAEELLQIELGLDYGFPDDGTVGPYTRRTGFATWIMPTGAGSAGIAVHEDVIISGACGRLTRVRLDQVGGDASETQVRRPGCVTAIEPLPGGRLLLGTVLGGDPFVLTTEADLFDQ